MRLVTAFVASPYYIDASLTENEHVFKQATSLNLVEGYYSYRHDLRRSSIIPGNTYSTLSTAVAPEPRCPTGGGGVLSAYFFGEWEFQVFFKVPFQDDN